MIGWSVVYTRARQELRAEKNLKRQGYRAWLPMMLSTKRRTRKIETVYEPVFPGYVFVQLDPEQETWSAINGTYGVKYLLADGRKPQVLPDRFVQSLRQTLDGDGACTLAPSKIKAGDVVTIVAGPFVDYAATVHELLPGDRIKLLLKVLGGSITASMSRRAVVAAV